MENRKDLPTGSRPAPGDLAFVQGFVNSIDVDSGRDAFSTTDGLARWLRHHGLLAADRQVGEAQRQEAIGFREALRSLLRSNHGEPLDRRALAELQEAACYSKLIFRYRASGELALEPAESDVHGALATLQAVIYQAMLMGTWQRLKICLSDSCQWAFYDSSKNRSGNWCSMQVCGNRMKVRSHRRRKSDERSA